MKIIRLSKRGQVVIPKEIRESRGWGPGMEFVVEEMRDGLLLRPVSRFAPTELSEVVGCLRSGQRACTLDGMRTAIDVSVSRRRDLGRY
ncbi:AbrB/MazE/SpoVT family DNA-binding domain-containing protein [uncultured Paludibaculum sp.]|uniref:AbrB/MazE/SpoVT family DNA-binding domain-containing protein n=1 Tax=uncultured Paludibaculum sp. TaxID=1765020 RepID=UPI002AAA7735|nr:AbrB/MazE/SpoVT family DNA-binding domain-containing protein [uncultured Paludibaculum sp.]